MSDARTEQRVYFEDVAPGTSLPVREFGPHTLVDGIRWAGVQEHPSPTHTDREHARERRGLKSFIASGANREAYLLRLLMDWVGPGGDLRKLSIRNTASTFEGDMMRFMGTVVEKSPSSDDAWIVCEPDGRNQDGVQIIQGRCTLVLPTRQASGARSAAPNAATPGATRREEGRGPDLDALITDEMRACIGRTSPLESAPEEISASDVRRYVQAVGDDNPLWSDDALARSVGYRARRVPHLLITQIRWRIGDRDPEELAESDWSGLVYPEGFTNFRNGGAEIEWFAPVYVGDRLSFQSRLVDIFARQGRGGPMILARTEGDIFNQDGDLVVRTTATGIRMRAARYAESPAARA